MPLKFEVASLDEVDEPLRSLYSESNGKFVLGVEGVVPKSKLDEFRNNNVQLARERDELANKFRDIDPELYRTLTSEHQKLKDKKLIDAGKIDELVEERVKEMRKKLEQERDGYKDQFSTARSRLEKVLIDNEASRYAVEMGCVETALDDIVMRARAQFTLDNDDRAIAVDGDHKVYGADGVTPLSIKEWMAGLVKRAPHLFKQSSGGGAAGSGGGPNSGATIKSKADLKGPVEKSKFIAEHGYDAFMKLPAAAAK
ncbi:hypothetical protein [Immundisolibacter sp.]